MPRGVCRCACGAGGVVTPRAAELDARLPDHETRRGQGYTVAPMMTSPADAMTKATRDALLDAQDVEIGKAASKAIKCILRGLIILTWVYLVDLMRRYVATYTVEELIFTICPLGILIVAVSMFFCILMGSLDECIPPIIPR